MAKISTYTLNVFTSANSTKNRVYQTHISKCHSLNLVESMLCAHKQICFFLSFTLAKCRRKYDTMKRKQENVENAKQQRKKKRRAKKSNFKSFPILLFLLQYFFSFKYNKNKVRKKIILCIWSHYGFSSLFMSFSRCTKWHSNKLVFDSMEK